MLDLTPSTSSWNSEKFPYRDILTHTATFAAICNTIILPVCSSRKAIHTDPKNFSVPSTGSRSEREYAGKEFGGGGTHSRSSMMNDVGIGDEPTRSVSIDVEDSGVEYVPTSYSNLGVGSPIMRQNRSPFGEPDSPSHGPSNRHTFSFGGGKSSSVEMAHSQSNMPLYNSSGTSRTGIHDDSQRGWGKVPPALGSISRSQGALFTSSRSHISIGDDTDRVRRSTATSTPLANVPEVVALSSSPPVPSSSSPKSGRPCPRSSPLFDVSLRRFLSCRDGEAAFKDFLVKEFAIENLR